MLVYILLFIIVITIIIIRINSCSRRSSILVGSSIESEWQLVLSGFKDYSEYSGRSQKYCSLDSLDSYTNIQLFQSCLQSFRDGTHTQCFFLLNCFFCLVLFIVHLQIPNFGLSFHHLLFSLSSLLKQENPQDDKLSKFFF